MTLLAAPLRALKNTYRHGFLLFAAAPAIPALAIVPEFAQHVVEIDLGMFAAREAARALSGDPLRWAFGYVKLAGFVLALLAAARFGWARERGGPPWWRADRIDWPAFLAGLAVLVGPSLVAEPLRGRISGAACTALSVGVAIATLPAFLHLLKGLFADRDTSVRLVWTRGWRHVPLLALLAAAAYAPAMGLHILAHHASFGRAAATVWTLMALDALVVGALASLTGSALFVGYRGLSRSVGGPR